MLIIFLVGFVLSVVFSLLLTPGAIKLANFAGAIDKPGGRKIHNHPIPRMGGIAPFVSFILTCLIVFALFPVLNISSGISTSGSIISVFSLFFILSVGICDDIWMLKPGQKFFAQLMAGTLIYFAGVRFSSFSIPFSGSIINLGIFSFPLTVFWVVGITNAFNLIDGLDGLAGGIAAISSLTIASIALLHSDISIAIICIILAGSLLGFLRYNFNPAKIFLGDSGSLFIGFTLAFLSIQSATKGSTAFSILIPILALGVPVLDTLIAMLRRLLNWFLPEQSLKASIIKKLHSMFLPDKRHIHHQLLARGLTQRKAVLILYVVSFSFGLCAYFITAGSINSSSMIILLGIAAAFTAKKLGYKEILIIKNGILLKLYSLTFLRHRLFRVFLDSVSVFAAFFLASLLSSLFSLFQNGIDNFIYSMAVICSLQLLAFVIGGLYKHSIRLSGIGDFLQIAKSTFIALAITAAAAYLLPLPGGWKWISTHSGIFITLDFYFLITFVAGIRISFHFLNYVFNRESGRGKKVLIYGAGYKGLITLQALINFNNDKCPVGFLDDDPELEGKFLNGYPVFGSHWKLEGLLKRNHVDEIIIADENVKWNVINKIKRIANIFNVPITTSKVEFKTLTLYKPAIDKNLLEQPKEFSTKIV